MANIIDLGPVMLIPKGVWDAEITYERLNVVRHGSAAWICKVETSTGVEPSEDSADWLILVKDISSVTSVNGQRGDVIIELTETETPPANDNSNRVATTEWVTELITDKLDDLDLPSIKDNIVLAAQLASTANSNALEADKKALEAKNGLNGVVRSINGTNADTSGNVALTNADIVESLGYTPLQTAPVTSVNGKTGAVTVGTVRSVNGVSADTAGNVAINVTPSTVYGIVGSAVAANGTSMRLPNGGTWFAFNLTGNSNNSLGSGSSNSTETGVGTADGDSGTGFSLLGGVYSGGTLVYAKEKHHGYDSDEGSWTYYATVGKLVAVRIS